MLALAVVIGPCLIVIGATLLRMTTDLHRIAEALSVIAGLERLKRNPSDRRPHDAV